MVGSIGFLQGLAEGVVRLWGREVKSLTSRAGSDFLSTVSPQMAAERHNVGTIMFILSSRVDLENVKIQVDPQGQERKWYIPHIKTQTHKILLSCTRWHVSLPYYCIFVCVTSHMTLTRSRSGLWIWKVTCLSNTRWPVWKILNIKKCEYLGLVKNSFYSERLRGIGSVAKLRRLLAW